MNKVIGAGLEAPIDAAALAALEEALRAHGEPVRVELSTLAAPEAGAALTARGYRLLGFENVLARALSDGARRRRARRATCASSASPTRRRARGRTTLVDGFAHPTTPAGPVDALTREAIAAVMDDFLAAPGFDRYLAWAGGALAGAASMRVHDGVALLTGSATLADAATARGASGADRRAPRRRPRARRGAGDHHHGARLAIAGERHAPRLRPRLRPRDPRGAVAVFVVSTDEFLGA